jgi:hypothetical protein
VAYKLKVKSEIRRTFTDALAIFFWLPGMVTRHDSKKDKGLTNAGGIILFRLPAAAINAARIFSVFSICHPFIFPLCHPDAGRI